MKLGLRPIRLLQILLLAVSAIPAVFAGEPMSVFVPEDLDPNTTADDRAKQVQLRWYDGAEPQFYIAVGAHDIDGQPLIFNRAAGQVHNLSTSGVILAINDALKTWNDAKWASFKFTDGVGTTDNAPTIPFGLFQYHPNRAALDGFNIITLIDDGSNGVAAGDMPQARLSYFARPFDINSLLLQPNSAISQINIIVANAQATAYLAADFNGDGAPDLFIPARSYKPGEIFDADIISPSNNASFFHTYPENFNDIPADQQAAVAGSVDVQALFTYLFGQARGIANSMIVDSAMYPQILGPTSTSTYKEQPYRRRVLSFDDQLAVGIADHGDFSSGGAGEISGQVVDGLNLSQTAATAATFAGATRDEFVVQAPVYILARPEQANSSVLSSGKPAIPAGGVPDDVISTPFDLANSPSAGAWRKVAQVTSGRNLTIATNSNVAFFPALPDPFGLSPTVPTGTQPGDGGTVTVPTDQQTPLIPYESLNSSYYFPGLPTNDDSGTSIAYAVRLENQVDGIIPDPVYQTFSSTRAETFPNEFYGGGNGQIVQGTGLFTAASTTTDDFFGNNFILAFVNQAGRFGAMVTDGLSILSGPAAFGQNIDPSSFFEVTSSKGTTSNQYANVGSPISGVQINDANATSIGTWFRTGDFQVRQTISISSAGGLVGVPEGLLVTYSLINKSAEPQTFKFRQILDTQLFGSQNPIYTINSFPINNATTLTGAAIPHEIHYQSSVHAPAYSAFVTLTGNGLRKPDSVTIAGLPDIAAGRTFTSGYPIRGFESKTSDSGIALEWDNLTIGPEEGRTLGFIIGYLPVGQIHDTWVNETLAQFTAGNLTGREDDAQFVEPITLHTGEKRDDIHIVTNTGTQPAAAAAGNQANGPLVFRLQSDALPANNFVHTCAALGDFDMDGDLDLVIGGVHGGNDPVASAVNRLYENRQRIEPDGSVTYYFVDVTYGPDQIPNTADDQLPGADRDTYGVVVADFDMDGDPDIYFCNRDPGELPNALEQSQMYINVGFPGHMDIAGKFEDHSDTWLPGLFNRARTFPGGLNNILTVDVPTKAAAGDIDGDGDIDLIVSQAFAFSDERYDSSGLFLLNQPSRGWIDVGPRIANQGIPNGDNRPNSSDDLWTTQLYWCERVLVNMTRVPPYQDDRFQGNYFEDDTLGRDGRAGTMTNFVDATTGQLTIAPNTVNAAVERELGDYIDRMPPIFPSSLSMAARTTTTSRIAIGRTALSNMGAHAMQPILGPFFSDNCLDLFSVRTFVGFIPTILDASFPESFNGRTRPAFTNTSVTYQLAPNPNPNPYAGAEGGFFRNSDVFRNDTGLVGQDGINDGYFVCINYNFDWAINDATSTAGQASASVGLASVGIFSNTKNGGLFPYIHTLNPTNADGFTSSDFILSDPMPLYIGMPAAHPANSTTGNVNIVPLNNVDMFTGVLGDWLNAGVNTPLMSQLNGAPIELLAAINAITGMGYNREQYPIPPAANSTPRGGVANAYTNGYLSPVVGWPSTGTNMSNRVLAAPTSGFITSSVASDFDRDGDLDLVTVGTTSGINLLNSFWTGIGTEGIVQLLSNSGLGAFVDNSAASIVPNDLTAHLDVATGDIDNDGDDDLVVTNGAAPDQYYRNDFFSAPPNLDDSTDRRMFYEASEIGIPPLGGANTGLYLRGDVGDVDGDGRPDFVVAAGGTYTSFGDVCLLYLNRGLEALRDHNYILQPAGADHPAPYHANLVTGTDAGITLSLIGGNTGVFGLAGPTTTSLSIDFFNDVKMGDIDNDGDLDMVSVAASSAVTQGNGPTIYDNLDTDNPSLNSIPDADSKGDGTFVRNVGAIGELIDRANVFSNSLVLKKQGNRAKFADVNHDGLLDLIIANGFGGGGAPNLMLLNDPNNPGHFQDVTDGVNHFFPVDNTPAMAGINDNTVDLAVGDFSQNGNVQIIFVNKSNPAANIGFRFLKNVLPPNGLSEGIYDDEAGHFLDEFGNPTTFLDTNPQSVAVADFDGIGEKTEDVNYNGHLDPGEDVGVVMPDGTRVGAGNGVIDYIDLPSETEDLNGNGVLDPGEDVGVMDENGQIVGAGDGILTGDFTDPNGMTGFDHNNDGIITARRNGVWEGSLDLFVTFDDQPDKILINDPSNTHPGYFRDRTQTLFPNSGLPQHSRGIAIGDVNNDGLPDIVIALFQGGIVTPVRFWLNTTVPLPNGNVRRGVFVDRSYEIPPARSFHSVSEETAGNPLFSSFANDVKLTDLDGDGDLDMIVIGTGSLDVLDPTGSANMVYINRLYGEGFGAGTRVNTGSTISPTVITVNPKGVLRGTTKNLSVYGQNFSGNVQFNFGPGVSILSVNNVQSYDPATNQTINLKSPPAGLDVTKANKLGFEADITIQIDPDATVGNRYIFVANPDGGATQSRDPIFQIMSSAPPVPAGNAVQEPNWALYP